MKTHYQPPKTQAWVHRPDESQFEYEVWVMVPKFAGSVRKVGTSRYVTEDGTEVTNLDQAAAHFMDSMKLDLGHGPKAAHQIKIKGMEIVKAGKWAEFCALRKMNTDDATLVAMEHVLTRKEANELGFTK